MKKMFVVMSVAILMALFSAPSIVKADSWDPYIIGQAIIDDGENTYISAIYFLYGNPTALELDGTWICAPGPYGKAIMRVWNYAGTDFSILTTENIVSGYIDSLTTNAIFEYNGTTKYIYTTYSDYENVVNDIFNQPLSEAIWDDFYELFYNTFGYYPMPGSIWDLLRNNAKGEDINITFPTLTPTPTPTPKPTPIPVQTIFVPDGNGNTTIIYQYPDPTSGVITQSPYNPNIENNITVNCDCDDGGGSGTFTNNPQDPYSLDASLLWADGFGVEISENPLQATEDQQATLKDAALEYDSSVQVMSNSFNILPIKWLKLVGLLGGILIIAGLIRTFLGG